MKNSNDQKGRQSTETKHNKALGALKDDGRFNPTGMDDDLAIDIQDTIGRETSLSMVADNIHVRVEGEIVTLEGEVFRTEEKMMAGDIATAFAGDDHVNNYLTVLYSANEET